MPVIAPRRDWRRDLPPDSHIEDIVDGNRVTLRITSRGHSQASDSASRRIQGQKDAMRIIGNILSQRLGFHAINVSRSEAVRLLQAGEITDLAYLDDGKTVEVTYDVPLPADYASKVLATD